MRRLVRGEWEIEERSLLAVSARGAEWTALNDAVLTRGGYPRLIRVRALVDGAWAGDFRADGLVVATPTGSTAYSLSAGGPIIAPGVDCMLITPICAHSLQHRPQVVPGGAAVTLRLSGAEPVRASLQIDGRDCGELGAGDSVEITRSAKALRLIRMAQGSFFDLVHRKLIEWAN